MRGWRRSSSSPRSEAVHRRDSHGRLPVTTTESGGNIMRECSSGLPVIQETEDIYRIATLHQAGLAVSEQREYDVGVSQLE
jgi:hypothetical protein